MDASEDVRAMLQIRRGEAFRVGPDRVRLLRAIAEHGSISAAGRAVGLTYRGAWEAVRSLNNLFDQPLVVSQAGGRQGGGASVTATGHAVAAGFEKLDGELSALMREFNASLSGYTATAGANLVWSLGMKTSARNAYRGVIETIIDGAVNAEVSLRISSNIVLTAIVTRTSVQDLELQIGREALALVKASFVILVPGDGRVRTSARNQLQGVVASHTPGAVNDEVVLDLGEGKTLTATITRGSGDCLEFAVGTPVQALVKASHVILAVE